MRGAPTLRNRQLQVRSVSPNLRTAAVTHEAFGLAFAKTDLRQSSILYGFFQGVSRSTKHD